MIRVSVEVCSGEARFLAAVWAKNIEHALSLVRARYPGGEATVIFPIEPEAFFVDGVIPTSEEVSLETPEGIAGLAQLGGDPSELARCRIRNASGVQSRKVDL